MTPNESTKSNEVEVFGDVGNDIFVHEVLSHPENRINVAMFGLMTEDWFRTWFLERLELPADAVVYPPKNERGKRPDFKVRGADGSVLARIEVELGTNPVQVEGYRNTYDEPVKTVFGRRSHDGDLSLEEIAERLKREKPNLAPQTRVNVTHLHVQIREGLDGHSSSPGRADVSDEMSNTPFVAELTRLLGDRLIVDGRLRPSLLKADTTASQGSSVNMGFSLRAKSRVAKSRTVSLLNITAGRDEVEFPPRVRLDRLLPDHVVEVVSYARVLKGLGLDIGPPFEEHGKPSLPVEVCFGALDRISVCVLALAGPPNSVSHD